MKSNRIASIIIESNRIVRSVNRSDPDSGLPQISPNIRKLNFQLKNFKPHKKSIMFFLALLIFTCTCTIDVLVSVVLPKLFIN